MTSDDQGSVNQSQQIRLLYFGAFRLESPRGRSLQLESSKKVLALLARHPAKRWLRTELAGALWPDADETAARNRLRTALAELRRTLPHGAIVGGKSWLELRAPVETDLAEFHQAVRRARLLEGTTEEAGAFERAVTLGQAPLLGNWHDSWAIAEREEVEGLLVQAFLRLAKLEPARAESWALRALELQPFNEEAWSTRLRAVTQSSRRFEVFHAFDQARMALRSKLDARFSRGLTALASHVRSGAAVAEERPSVYAAGNLLASTLQRMMEEDSESALAFLGSESFRAETFRSPELAWPVLDAALGTTRGTTPMRRRAAANLIFASTLLHRHSAIRTWGHWLLEHEDDVHLRRATATFLAYAAFLEGHWEEAEESAELAYRLSLELRETRGIHVSRAQIAGLWFHQLRFDDAEDALQTSFAALAAESSRPSRVGQAEVALLLGNLYFFKLRPALAVNWYSLSLELAEELDYRGLLRSVLTGLGASQIACGDRELGAENLARGLGLSVNPIDPSAVHSGLEAAAMAMAACSQFNLAAAALELSSRFRAASHQPRSPAEQAFVQAVQERIGLEAPDLTLMKRRTRRSVVSGLIDHLISMSS